MTLRSYGQGEVQLLFPGLSFHAGDAIKVKSQFVGQEGQLVAGLHLGY